MTGQPNEEIKWTDEQWEAIQEGNQNILVSAAAGSGKTAVLVNRIIEMIKDPKRSVDVNRLLVVTFTNAAAAGMKKKVAEAIEEELERNDSSRLQKQLSLLNSSSISTLHSFCLDVIRNYHFEIGMDPKFRLLDEQEAKVIRIELLHKILENYYSKEKDHPFFRLADSFSNDRSDDGLGAFILKLYHFSRSHDDPRGWLEENLNRIVPGSHSFDLNRWKDIILNKIMIDLSGAKDRIGQALSLCRAPGGPYYLTENLESDLVDIDQLLTACQSSWEDAVQAFLANKPTTLKRKKKEDVVDEELAERVKKLRDKYKEAVKKALSDDLSKPDDQAMADMQEMVPVIRQLIEVTTAFADSFRNYKTRYGLMDFSDLEHYCLQILSEPGSSSGARTPSKIARSYQEHFVEILVDEYQDTNDVQEAIIQLVAKGDNVFMVGDVKQSIYRFRLAEPNLFLTKYKKYQIKAADQGRKIILRENFRSRAQVLDATNFIFKQIMDKRIGEIDYDQEAELKLGADYPHGKEFSSELILLDKANGQASAFSKWEDMDAEEDARDSDHAEAEQEAARLEARCIARRILAMRPGEDHPDSFQVYDSKKKQYRNLQYKDIVILLRSTQNWADAMAEELQNQGIPIYAESSSGFFQSTEVSIMLSLLKIIDNPFQDIPLAAVLRSPLAGLTERELAELRISFDQAKREHKQKQEAGLEDPERDKLLWDDSFYAAVKYTLKVHQPDKLFDFKRNLDRWRDLARHASVAELLEAIYKDTKYDRFAAGLPNGKQRQANLQILLERAKQYEATSFRGLFRFLRFIEKLEDQGQDLGAARAAGDQENVVRIMTIHKSKGLEFPVVFVAGLGKLFNVMDEREDLLINKELGFGVKCIDTVTRQKFPTLSYYAVKHKMHMEMLAEEMRVLYVALTRAKEKLILVSTVKDLADYRAKWNELLSHEPWLLPDSIRAKAKCYLDWIMPSLIRHRHAEAIMGEAGVVNQEIHGDPSMWLILTENATDGNSTPQGNETDSVSDMLHHIEQGMPMASSGEFQDKISQALSWSYPHKRSAETVTKRTVSEIKRQNHWESDESSVLWDPTRRVLGGFALRPQFLQGKAGTPAERGIATHTVMQHLPFGSGFEEMDLHRFIQSLVEKGHLTEHQASFVKVPEIKAFLNTPLGQRLQNAKTIQREIPFSYRVPAHLLDETETESDDEVLVQGVIDCLFEEEDGWVLIDYKTDYVDPESITDLHEVKRELQARYSIQMKLYAQAIETIWNGKLKDRYLYFFSIQDSIDLQPVSE